jgi:hypothetical protein
MELAGCRPCNIVWFDAQNYQLVPEWTVASNTGITMQDIETESLRRLKELKEREKAVAEEEKKKKIAATLVEKLVGPKVVAAEVTRLILLLITTRLKLTSIPLLIQSSSLLLNIREMPNDRMNAIGDFGCITAWASAAA